MRRLVALVAVLVAPLASVLLVLAASPASAGGPTSVLVVNHDGHRASGALTGSEAYAALETALDAYNQPTGEDVGAESFMSTPIRLTWMIHDVTPWRVDAVFVDGTDVWVETTMDVGTGQGLFESPGVRHRPQDAQLLLSTLVSLGVLSDLRPSAAAAAPTAPGQGADAAGAASAASSTTLAGSASSSGPGHHPWWVTVAAAALALGLGMAVGGGVGRSVGRRAGGDDAGPVGVAGDPAGGVGENVPTVSTGARPAAYDGDGRTPVKRFTLR